jgi:hypothetical protein
MAGSNEADDRVVPFRPRRPPSLPVAPPQHPERNAAAPKAEVENLEGFERTSDPDDYRHRMITNAVALIFTVVLVVAGVWLANAIVDMRKNQDCVLTGRRGCTPVEVPPAARY